MTRYHSNENKSYSGDLMKLGEAGEAAFYDHFFLQDNVIYIDDFRTAPEYQDKEIDFRISFTSGEIHTFEVKTDAYFGKTGNLLFETDRYYRYKDRPHDTGWGWKSEADYLAIVAPYLNQIHIFAFDELRMAVNRFIFDHRRNPDRLKKAEAWVATDRTKTTRNLLLPSKYWRDITTRIIDLPERQKAIWEELL